jgi:hypothetical protein
MSAPDRLYGEPDAETLHADIDAAIAGHLWLGLPDDDAFTIHEWTVTAVSPPKPATVIELVCEWIADDLCQTERDDNLWGARADPDCLATASALVTLIASRVTWQMANQHVATWTVVIRPDGTPLATRIEGR